jgi:hypothetical protein
MRIALAFLFIAHGIAHLPGFLVPWRLAAPAGVPYTTAVIDGAVELGPVGIRVVGGFWLLAALAFVVAGVATFHNSAQWPTLALGVTLFSLGLSVLGWPQARIGLVLNLLLLAYLLLGGRLGWLGAP